jgi:hypothetical protein
MFSLFFLNKKFAFCFKSGYIWNKRKFVFFITSPRGRTPTTNFILDEHRLHMPQNATYTGDVLPFQTALFPVTRLDYPYSGFRDISDIRYMLPPDLVLFIQSIIRYYHGIFLFSP